ncbi:unnamed protein product [Paramecium pentaurelia]|uniref:Transmembrane protein n=1 Tax=Paramecium pentaurelia TaxID=43138 RepID=A0A8S1VTS6_9CILI|nr:unnamed protein product [Paramecium pentaurelia]
MSEEESTDGKFDYLKAKYVFRFPFTVTALKWGFGLGTFFGIHQYIKSRDGMASMRWFIWGNVLTTLPIWGFFMMKYSFYSSALRKFESEQSRQYEIQGLTRVYLANKMGIDPECSDEDLLKEYQKKSEKIKEKYNLLDELLVGVDFSQFEFPK